MPRRTVTIPEGLDTALRGFQARLMLASNQDVTYTQVVNIALFWGLTHFRDRGPALAIWKEGEPLLTGVDVLSLLVGFDLEMLRREGHLDMLPEEARAAVEEKMAQEDD